MPAPTAEQLRAEAAAHADDPAYAELMVTYALLADAICRGQEQDCVDLVQRARDVGRWVEKVAEDRFVAALAGYLR